jgi:ketosteroid isomerase-like protein
MKHIIVLAVVGLLLAGCTSSAEKKEKDNLAVARKYMEAVETKNLAVIDSLLADNYMGYGPSIGDSINKEGAVLNTKYLMENFYESFEYTRHKELAVTVTEGEAIGDWVLNWAYLTIKFKDGSGPVYLWVNIVYRIENGKIVHSRTFYNEADVMRQLGYTMVR